jgi:outer membrane immunogenic protein
MQKKILAMAIASVAISSVALPGAASATDYEGPYAAVSGGLGVVKFDGTVASGAVSNTTYSGIAGGVLGFRAPLGPDGRFVLGIEGDVDFYTSGSEVRFGGYGIAGYRIMDEDLLYLRAGYAKLSSYSNSFATDIGLDGWVLGAGYEHSLNDSFSVRLDYRFLNYGDTNVVNDMVNYSGHEIKAALVMEF